MFLFELLWVAYDVFTFGDILTPSKSEGLEKTWLKGVLRPQISTSKNLLSCLK
jgi:hypothetical protein